MPTSVAYRGLVYILRDNGILRARRAATGELFYEQRVGTGGGGFTASLVAGDGKVVFCHAGGTSWSLIDIGISACVPHLSHSGDVHPSTGCDS